MSFVTAAWAGGCDLTTREQISLLELTSAVPAAGQIVKSDVRGQRIECAEIGELQVISIAGRASYYILDRKRAFNQWSDTGAYFGKNRAEAINNSLLAYRAMDAESLWLNYGRPPFRPAELNTAAKLTDLRWIEVQLQKDSILVAAAAEPLDGEQEQLMERLLRDQIRIWLATNARVDLKTLQVSHTPMHLYTTVVSATVSASRDAKKANFHLRLPLNASIPPFVGYASGGEVQ